MCVSEMEDLLVLLLVLLVLGLLLGLVLALGQLGL